MGQRSQIYVRVNDMAGRKYLVARYFQWNYQERMVSRARHTLEWLKMYEGWPYSLCQGDNNEKLKRVLDTNFDYHDITLGIDLIKGYTDEVARYKANGWKPVSFKESVFYAQDNNDGQLFIDMIVDYDHLDKNKNPKVKYKYGFFMVFGFHNRKPITPEEYMQLDYDFDESNPWRESEYLKDCVKMTERNIRYIEKHATLMTEEEALEFANHDYVKDMFLGGDT